MRDIVFRGKRIDNREWIYGFYYKTKGKHIILGDREPDSNGQKEKEINPETVGQFTGMYDKNGVKIFEGDIIQRDYKVAGKTLYEKRVIEYKSAYFAGFQFIKGKPNNMGCEVIGNIHDNPELLEAK